MLKKTAIILSLILSALIFGSNVSAQTVGEATFAVSESKLSTINLPNGARQIKDENVPQEFRDTFAKLIAAGGDQIRQGDSEVIVWEGNYQKSSGSQMIGNLEKTLKNSGWQYEVGAKDKDFVLFSLFRAEPQRRALVGFFVPAQDGFIFALTEMIRAEEAVGQTSDAEMPALPPATESAAPQTISASGELSIYGKWQRSTGGGQVDPTGKTRYKSGENFTFEFLPDGTMNYLYDKDVLAITQCTIKENSRASGTIQISGDTLTMNLGAMTSVGTGTCDKNNNFRRTLAASTLVKKFTVKRLESIFRPDSPVILCFDGQKDEDCFEKVKN